MRAVVVDGPGSYDRLLLRDRPDPEPGPEEVLVDVEAAGINYADCLVRMGLYRSAREFVGWPITPGFEFAGKVARAGAGAEDHAIGAPVFGVTRFGGYATRVAVPRRQLRPVPAGIGIDEAAAFPAVFLTAWFPLHFLATTRSGMRLLVHSAAGGVGGALVQLGRLAGCSAVGVVGAAHKVEVVRALGASAVIDKSREDWRAAARAQAPDGYDFVFDANGAETLRDSWRLVAPAGRLVVYGFHSMMPRSGGRPRWLSLAWGWLTTPRFSPLTMTHENRSVLAFNLSYLFHRADLLAEGLDRLASWLAEGKLRPPAVTRFPFDRVADAHRELESAQTVGKLVLWMGR